MLLSVWRSVQVDPHRSGWAARQTIWHWPTPVASGLQVVPEGQTVPHLPQLLGSFVVFLQAKPPPPCGHEVGASTPQYFEQS